MVLVPCGPAAAQCDLQAIQAYTCNASANSFQPAIGETYFIRINFNVVGQPKQPYKVRFQIANRSWDWTTPPMAAGNSYYGFAGFTLPLGDEITYKITLDPERVSGDTNVANNTVTGTFTPTPPATSVEFYNPRRLKGSQTFSITWKPGSGKIDRGYSWLGRPTSESFQNVISAWATGGSEAVVTTPNNRPLWQQTWGASTPAANNHTWSMTQHFVVDVAATRINTTVLRNVPWTRLTPTALSSDIKNWLQPDKLVQSTSPEVVQFVKSTLPPNYRTTIQPFDAITKLYLATVKRLSYTTPVTDFSAVATLKTGRGDCLCFSNVFIASLRAIGVPARSLCGWWQGNTKWHCMAEFYLPGSGWVIADPTSAKLWWDPTGTYPYLLGNHNTTNTFCAVGRGSDHQSIYLSMTNVQAGWSYYRGTAVKLYHTNTTTLTPLRRPFLFARPDAPSSLQESRLPVASGLPGQ
jgi:transglutaminase-like putative cysteine protease